MAAISELSISTRRELEGRILHNLLNPSRLRRWRERCVTKYEALDEERVLERTSFQFRISPKLLSRCLYNLNGKDEKEQDIIQQLLADPVELETQEIEVILPFSIYPKRILLNFSLEGIDANPILVSRHASSRVSLDFALRMYFRYDTTHKRFISQNRKILRSLLFQAPEDLGRQLLAHEVGVASSQFFNNQMAPNPQTLEKLNTQTNRIMKCVQGWLTGFVDAGVLAPYSTGLNEIIHTGMRLQKSLEGIISHAGQYDPVLNPIMLILDYFKLYFELNNGDSDATLSQFVRDAKAYLAHLHMLFNKGVTTQKLIYSTLNHFSYNYVAYAPCKIKIGRPFIIKTEQILPLVGERGMSFADWAKYYLSQIKPSLYSKYRSIAFPIEIGDDASRHYEIMCPSHTELHLKPSSTFLEIGGRRFAPSTLFGYTASDSIERQHFYTTKTHEELEKILESRNISEGGDIRLWIRYELDLSIRLAYFCTLIFFAITTYLFFVSYDPSNIGVSPLLVIPIMNPLLALFLSLRPKERITLQRLQTYRIAFAVMSVGLVVYFLLKTRFGLF